MVGDPSILLVRRLTDTSRSPDLAPGWSRRGAVRWGSYLVESIQRLDDDAKDSDKDEGPYAPRWNLILILVVGLNLDRMGPDSRDFGPIFSWIRTTPHFGLGILGLSTFNLDMDPELSPGPRNTLGRRRDFERCQTQPQ